MAHGARRILCVDADAAIVTMLHDMLEDGYDVVECTSSVTALDTFQHAPHAFDLVITDYTMPEMSGEVLIRALRRVRPDIPIILCSGSFQDMPAWHAQTPGINAFLRKPVVTPAEVHRVVQHVFQQCLEHQPPVIPAAAPDI